MNLFQQLTVGGLSVLVLAMASSVSANACDKTEVTCKTNKEWKEQSRGCELKRIDIFGGR